MSKPEQEDIDYILDTFDFRKVQECMKMLKWTWWDAEEGVPNERELKECARALLKKSYDYETISTGGFIAKNNNGELSLEFTLEKAEVWTDE